MSKIQEMLDRMCPEGVEYKKIKDVFTRIKGTPITATLMKEIASEEGDVRIFAGGKTVIDAKRESIPNANITTVPSLVVQSRGVIDFVFYDKPFTFKNEMWGYTHQEPICVKFLRYVLKNNVEYFRRKASETGSLPQISLPITEEFEIPVPPIEVQKEIVKVLDRFSEHTAALVTELDAELAARKKQYEYYLDNLLSNYLPHQKAKEYSLGELFVFKNGLNASKEQFGHGKPIVNYVNVYKKSSITKDDLTGKVELDASSIERYRVQRGDVFFTRTSETQEEVGITSVLLDEIEDCVFSGFVLRARPISDVLLPEFCKYCFATQNIRKQIILSSTLTTRALTNGTSLSKVRIQVPSLAEQKRIVSILDRFEALTASLSEGLPAEIKARQQQYEYYRDQLLTFKRAN